MDYNTGDSDVQGLSFEDNEPIPGLFFKQLAVGAMLIWMIIAMAWSF